MIFKAKKTRESCEEVCNGNTSHSPFTLKRCTDSCKNAYHDKVKQFAAIVISTVILMLIISTIISVYKKNIRQQALREAAYIGRKRKSKSEALQSLDNAALLAALQRGVGGWRATTSTRRDGPSEGRVD